MWYARSFLLFVLCVVAAANLFGSMIPPQPSTIDGTTGMWLSCPGRSELVAVYFDRREGPVVGVYSSNHKAIAAALCIQNGEGAIQLMSKDGDMVCVTATDLKRLLK